MFCTHVISAYSATCAEQWLIVFRCLRSGVTICGPRERRNVHNDISETFQMAMLHTFTQDTVEFCLQFELTLRMSK